MRKMIFTGKTQNGQGMTEFESQYSNSASLTSELNKCLVDRRKEINRGCNFHLIVLFWKIGHLLNAKTIYEKNSLAHISKTLSEENGPFFKIKNLLKIIQFAREFPALSIVNELAPFLSWRHFIELSNVQDPKRKYS